MLEPIRAAGKSLRTVAAEFAPHIPAGETIYVDTGDSYSSFFYYLERSAGIWRMADKLFPESRYVLLVGDQPELLASRGDLELKIVASKQGPNGRGYALGIIKPVAAQE